MWASIWVMEARQHDCHPGVICIGDLAELAVFCEGTGETSPSPIWGQIWGFIKWISTRRYLGRVSA